MLQSCLHATVHVLAAPGKLIAMLVAGCCKREKHTVARTHAPSVIACHNAGDAMRTLLYSWQTAARTPQRICTHATHMFAYLHAWQCMPHDAGLAVRVSDCCKDTPCKLAHIQLLYMCLHASMLANQCGPCSVFGGLLQKKSSTPTNQPNHNCTHGVHVFA